MYLLASTSILETPSVFEDHWLESAENLKENFSVKTTEKNPNFENSH